MIAVVLAVSSLASRAGAWVYPEHRDIAILSVEKLDPERRQVFDQLWGEARAGHEARLCTNGADTEQATTPDCIDWAALSAIAGDHSCSSQDMLEIVIGSDWILDVADISAQLKKDLGEIEVAAPAEQAAPEGGRVADLRRRMESEGVRADRINVLRTADTRLQRADPEYATRAGSNNAHFLFARPDVDTEARDYGLATLSPDAEINAVGVYVWYHFRAMEKAARLRDPSLTPAARQALARAMLADEAFALHFLEDTYAAGHVAGTWGDASQRKGTHDYYNEAGLEAVTWEPDGMPIVLMGDAHMRPQDAELAASAVAKSVAQLLDVAAGREGAPDLEFPKDVAGKPEALDVCLTMTMPEPAGEQLRPGDSKGAMTHILLPTAVPGLGPGLGALPRFRAEVGPFVGLVAGLDVRGLSGGFASGQPGGAMGGIDLAFRAGLGLDGVVGESGDGLVYAQVGFRADSPSSGRLSNSQLAQEAGSISASIPSRVGLATRFRMPFYLVPGDLLFLSPLYFADPETYTKMAVTAGNGGLIPWQLGIATGVGRFQFVLGRELGLNFYGLLGDNDRLIIDSSGGDPGKVVDYDSIGFDFPIFEYRPYRAFSSNQSSSLFFQFFGGVDVPIHAEVVVPDGADVNLHPVYSLGVRFTFDWRYYY